MNPYKSLLALAVLLLPACAYAKDPRPDEFVDSRYAVLRDAYADRAQVRPGEEFTIALRLTPYESQSAGAEEAYQFHIYGHEEGDQGFPTALLMDPAEGVVWGEVAYPRSEKHEDATGVMYWLKGQSVLLVKGKLAGDAAPGKREFTAQLNFMACTEEMCLSPDGVPVKWELEVVGPDFAGDISVRPAADLLAPAATDWSRFVLPEEDEESQEAPPAAVGADSAGSADSGAGGGPSSWPGPSATYGTITPDQWKPRGASESQLSLWKAILLGFLGGLILNFMPCVLPVVSIKVISLARHAEQHPQQVVKQGLVFCLGIIATFLLLALIVAILQAGGEKLGWGFQFQNPTFLIVMASIVFAFALSLAGVYTIKPPAALTEAGEKLSEQEGYLGSFFKGVLATVLGTPCVGPFLGPALGFAFSQPAGAVFAIFGSVGLGMALPYAGLVANPRFLRMGQRERGKLTRSIMESKNWLVDFERVMAFILFATVIYLLNILQGGLGAHALIWTLCFLLVLAFALWLWGRLVTMGRRAIYLGILLVPALIVWGAWYSNDRINNAQTTMTTGATLPWEPFSLQALDDYVAQGHSVLVDFTAEWCPNCKYNEATALNVPDTASAVKKHDVKCLKADWTTKSEEITYALNRLGYSSIPLSAVFPAADPNHPILLDGVFTSAKAVAAISQASGG